MNLALNQKLLNEIQWAEKRASGCEQAKAPIKDPEWYRGYARALRMVIMWDEIVEEEQARDSVRAARAQKTF